MIDWGQIGGATTAAGVVLGGLFRLWGAIKKRFDHVEITRTQQIEAVKMHNESMLAQHEVKDSQRHDDNLGQFKDINKELIYIGKALVGLGWRNGRDHGEKSADH